MQANIGDYPMTCEWEQFREFTEAEKKKLYSKIAFQRATKPKNLGDMKNADGFARVTGPCGDTMEIWLKVNDGVITDATFVTDGCGNSIASCSTVTEMAKGKSIVEAQQISQQDILNDLGGLPSEGEHCALLAANTLKAAFSDFLKKDSEERAMRCYLQEP
jgi:nitrogen fixation NifU-like protein